MHETGIIRALIDTAIREAQNRGGSLTAICVRLGALSEGTASHLRDHFEVELGAMGLGGIELHIDEQPLHPAGIEITGIEFRR